MLDQFFQVAGLEGVEVSLEVGAGGLGSGADGHGLAVEVVGRGTGLVDVGAEVVVAGDQETDAVRTTVVALGAGLHLVAHAADEAVDGQRGIATEAVGEAFCSHVLAEKSGVGGQTCDGNPAVVVDGDDLLLVGGQFGRGSLQSDQDSMSAVFQSDSGRSLFDGLHGVFHLVDAALRTPDSNIVVILVSKHFLKLTETTINKLKQ